MGFILQNTFTHVLLFECFVGVTVNVFIAAVQIMEWRAVKSLETCNQILLCLGTSRSISLINVYLTYLVGTYNLWVFHNLMVRLGTAAASFFLYFNNSWLIAVLCVSYCVKIVSYNHKVLIFMKTRISRLVPWFIVASVLISAASSIPCAWTVVFLFRPNLTSAFHGNDTGSDGGLWQAVKGQFILVVLSYFTPFFISCGSTFLLIHSLWRHTSKMRCSGTGFKNPNIEVHIAVVKNMSFVLLLQLLDFGCCLSTFFTFEHVSSSWRVLFVITGCAPSILHSAHLVYSNARLNQAFREMWHGLIRCCKIQ